MGKHSLILPSYLLFSKSKKSESIHKCIWRKSSGSLSPSTAKLTYYFFVTVLVWKRYNNTLFPTVLFPTPSNIFSGRLGLHCLPGRQGKLPAVILPEAPQSHREHHGCSLGISHAVSPHRRFAFCLLVWAYHSSGAFSPPLVFLYLPRCENANGCCVRKRIIFLSRYSFLSAPLPQQSVKVCMCVHNTRHALA